LASKEAIIHLELLFVHLNTLARVTPHHV